MSERRLFTSSSVLRGHPDKLCDRISDALVDAHLSVDPTGRIRAEAAAAGQVVFVVTDAQIRGAVDVTGVVGPPSRRRSTTCLTWTLTAAWC